MDSPLDPHNPLGDLPRTRREYGAGRLDGVADTPFAQFSRWYADARDASVDEPNAMVLATVDEDGPDGRLVLLKGFDPLGFVFYTNYGSTKGRQLGATPRAALTFPWHGMQRQVRVRGSVEPVSAELSDAYFLSRDEDSRLGAWASAQSQPIDSRASLEAAVERVRQGESGSADRRPPHWGGYRVRPSAIEFWQGGRARIHDRFLYRTPDGSPRSLDDADAWTVTRLQP
ncbi:pyridoxamine 5'-phosphate oxidase [Brevibacterium samyangense]